MSESAVADEIGRIGESFFDYEMSKTDLLVGRIDPDRVGKDRVIEAKLASRSDTVSFDKRPAPLACSLQIKTVLHTSKVITLTLSVAERLAQSPTPAFVYIIRLNCDREPFETRAIHIIGSNLEKILKRLRKEFAAGTKNLHEKTISFQVRDAMKVGLRGHHLTSYLECEIGPDMDAYAQRKRSQKQSLGYEAGRSIRITGSVEAKAAAEMVDGLLGLRPLSVARLKAEDQRFGIALPDHSFPKFAPGTLAYFKPSPAGKTTLVLGKLDGEDTVEVTCDVIMPPMAYVPLQHFKTLLRSPFVQATISAKECQITTIAEWADNKARAVSEWISYFRVLLALSSEACTIALRGPSGLEPLGVATRDSPPDDGEVAYTLKLLKALEEVRNAAGTPDRALMLDELYRARASIFQVHDFLRGQFRDDFHFNMNAPESEIPDENEFLYVSGFSVGDEYYAYGARCLTHAKLEDGKLQISQAGPFEFVDMTSLSDFDGDLRRYQERLMRISRAALCLITLTEGEHISDSAEVGELQHSGAGSEEAAISA